MADIYAFPGGDKTAFPTSAFEPGMTLRDYFAIHAPHPEDSAIELQERLDQSRNPYNESHRPRIRAKHEIVADLRFKFADTMLAARGQSND